MSHRAYQTERDKWDTLAARESRTVSVIPPAATFHVYASRTSLMAGVADFLGDLRGTHVLEYGCGLGEISTLLAKSDARVTAFDLSPISIGVARQRAMMNAVGDMINLVVAAGENLPYADESFDMVLGKAILHHLNVNLGGIDLYRVLKGGGKAAFVEPMGMNPILNFVRDYVPYPNKRPRGTDRPLNYDDMHAWAEGFTEFRYQETHLLSMFERGLGFHKRLGILRRADAFLLKRLPFLRRYCRYVVMFMVK